MTQDLLQDLPSLRTYLRFDPSPNLGVLISKFFNRADLLVAINNAARLLSHQGKYAEAERMHRDALVKTEKLMGSVRETPYELLWQA